MKFYSNSIRAWQEMLAALTLAKKSIYIEMYIFSDDTSETHDFVSTLVEKSRTGVQVVLILDAFGSSDLSQETRKLFAENAIEVQYFRHWIHRTHRKTVIVDNTTAFIGGVNITKHASEWDDLQIKVTGRIVRELVKIFTRTYKLSGGTTKLLVPEKYLKRKHAIRMWVLEHTPLSGIFSLKKYYKKKINSAKKSITLVTPYFIPHAWLMYVLGRAVARGIIVTILIPEKTDSKILDAINKYYAAQATDIGARVIVTRGTNHAKAALIDSNEGLVGSGNLDSLSFDRNSELGIFFTGKKSVRQLETIIQSWTETGTLFTETNASLPWYYKIIALVLKFLHPFL
jgi:cardiolipin synthase A/B